MSFAFIRTGLEHLSPSYRSRLAFEPRRRGRVPSPGRRRSRPGRPGRASAYLNECRGNIKGRRTVPASLCDFTPRETRKSSRHTRAEGVDRRRARKHEKPPTCPGSAPTKSRNETVSIWIIWRRYRCFRSDRRPNRTRLRRSVTERTQTGVQRTAEIRRWTTQIAAGNVYRAVGGRHVIPRVGRAVESGGNRAVNSRDGIGKAMSDADETDVRERSAADGRDREDRRGRGTEAQP